MIPLKYNIQNLKARSVSTLMSVLGIGIVIAVMLSMMALYNGVRKATTTSGSKDATRDHNATKGERALCACRAARDETASRVPTLARSSSS